MNDTDSEITVTVAVCWFDIASYGFVLVFAVHNSVRYLIRQKRWDNVFLLAFYVLTILIAIFRLIYLLRP